MTPTLSVDLAQPRSIRELLTDPALSDPGTVGGVVSPPDEAGVLALPAPEALDTLPAASNARTVYEYVVDAARPVSE